MSITINTFFLYNKPIYKKLDPAIGEFIKKLDKILQEISRTTSELKFLIK